MKSRLSCVLVSAIMLTFKLSAVAANVKSLDIDLSAFGFKAFSSRDLIGGIVGQPRCLFIDQNHILVVAPRKVPTQALAKRDQPDSQSIHYSGVLINLSAGKVVSTVDLGGATYFGDGEVLNDGTLIFYRHGSLDFWRLGQGETLQKQKSVPVNTLEIDNAVSAKRQLLTFGLFASYSHKTLYLYVAAPISRIAKLWQITSESVRALEFPMSTMFLPDAVESDAAVLGLKDWNECRFYLIPNAGGQPASEFYHFPSCSNMNAPSFIGPGEIVFTSTLKNSPPEFWSQGGQSLLHPGVGTVGLITAAWDGSTYMGVSLRASGGSAAFDVSSHISRATITVFDHGWHQRCRFMLKIEGADLSGPHLSPQGDRIVAYDNGHLYVWNVDVMEDGHSLQKLAN